MAILDASLLVALVANDPRSGLVSAALRRWLEAGVELHLPDLALYELASGLTRLVRAGAMPAERVEEVWEQIGMLPLTFHRLAGGPRAVSIALTLDRASAYDASYLALGERLEATVWTLDARLFRNASARGFSVRLLDETAA